MKSIVYSEKCDEYDYSCIKHKIKKILSNFNDFFSNIKDKVVLLKPNLLSEKTPDKVVTTHPFIIKGVVEFLLEKGINKIYLGDGPGGFKINYDNVLKMTGIRDILDEYPKIKLFDVSPDDYYEVKKNGITYYFPNKLHDIDVIINLPKIKTHSFAVFTCAIKNLYGLIPGPFKKVYHYEHPSPTDFAKVLVDIADIVKPQLTIVDGIIGMQGNGPSQGFPAPIGYILASTDIFSVDIAAAYLLGYDVKDIDYFLLAEKRKLGNKNFDVIGEPLKKGKNFKLKSNTLIKLSLSAFGGILQRLFWIYPNFNHDKCTKCYLCVSSCPRNAIKLDENKYPVLIKEHCQSCLCCHELCNFDAIDLDKSLLAKIIVGSE